MGIFRESTTDEGTPSLVINLLLVLSDRCSTRTPLIISLNFHKDTPCVGSRKQAANVGPIYEVVLLALRTRRDISCGLEAV